MEIVKNGLVVEDIWQPLGGRDPGSLNPSMALLVSTSELATYRDALAGFSRLGLALAPADDVRAIVWVLDRLEVVVLTLPKFNDGRAFSQARLLRDAHGFGGEVRAAGHILPDQLGFLRRSGVDAVAVPKDDLAEAWVTAWEAEAVRFKGHYQPAFEARTNRALPGEISGGSRRWARSPAVVDIPVGTLPVHETSWAGAWGY
jgi:uncharacterized protein (DUF934 family)